MPKFSAYMRGEEGPQGNIGQAVLLDGYVSSSSELPPNLDNQKNLVYYVGDESTQEYHLWIYTTTEITTSTSTYKVGWHDLGSVKGPKGNTGEAAGFALNHNSEIIAIDPNEDPDVSIVANPYSPDTAKVFDFTFKVPRGQNAGFSENHEANIVNVDTPEEAYVHVSTDENSPNTAKSFNFEFGIPRGEAAGFGEPTVSISTISSLSTASVSITSSGDNTSKVFDFHFNIPQGLKGDRGDSFSVYEPVAFTTGSEYWINDTTFVYPRGDNSKLPVYIYNEDTGSLLDSSFTYTSTDIIYNVQQPFNGTLYLMSGANRPTIAIGEVSTTSFDGEMSASLNPRSTSSDAIIDFTLAHGPTGEPGGFGEITSTAELLPSTSSCVEKNSIVSFSTECDINKIVVDIEPVQDLHGYDNPWPAGGGKNLLPLTLANLKTINTTGTWTNNKYVINGISYQVLQDESGNVTGIKVSGTASARADFMLASGMSFADGNYMVSSGTATSSIQTSYMQITVSGTYDTVLTTRQMTGTELATSSARIITTSGAEPDVTFQPQIESGTTATSYAPYSNICPISGWTGVNVQRTGKNLLDFDTMLGSKSGGIDLSGTAEDFMLTTNNSGSYTNFAFAVPIPKSMWGKTISLTGIQSFFGGGTGYSNAVQIRVSSYVNKSNAQTIVVTNNEGSFDIQAVIPDGTLWVIPFIGIGSANYVAGLKKRIQNLQLQLLDGNTSNLDFSPYQGTTYPISWQTGAGTVYGGSLDVTTGVLTVTKGCFTLTGASSEQWGSVTVGSNYYSIPLWVNSAQWKPSQTAICDKFPKIELSQRGQITGLVNYSSDNGYRFSFNSDFGITTTAELKTWLSTNPVTICAELATPITYQLTPTQITALLGQNNIWADTGDIQVYYDKFNQPYVEITTDEDSPNEAKRFYFHFGIPEGKKGSPGDAFAIYEPLSFTTGSLYWNENTLIVPQGENNKLPLFIYNEDNNNIAATFKIENGYIKHEADSPFNGTLYMMSQTNRSILKIGNVSTTTYGNGSSFSLNPESTSTDAIFDVVLEQGPKGETALTAQVGRVSYTSGDPKVEIEGDQNLIFNFDIPKGFKGDKGDTFTVNVDEAIEVLDYYENPIVETTSTSTGISLKFKLPPSISTTTGVLSKLDRIKLDSHTEGILPVNKGGTGLNKLTTNAILLGNDTNAIKQKTTSKGAFYVDVNNAEPIFGTLPIEYGGTGTTTAAKAWTALGGGESGKHPEGYYALAGQAVSYGDTVSAINSTSSSAGTAPTVSRSDHVHNIAVASGNSNGTIRIANQEISVKGLKSAAYTESTAYAAASHTHNYLPLAGGTVTGWIRIKNLDLNNTDQSRSADTVKLLEFQDKNTKRTGQISNGMNINGQVYTTMLAGRYNEDVFVQNYIALRVSKDFTPDVVLSAPQAWRKQLGLGTSAGALPIQPSQGGTGQTTLINSAQALLKSLGAGQTGYNPSRSWKMITTDSAGNFLTRTVGEVLGSLSYTDVNSALASGGFKVGNGTNITKIEFISEATATSRGLKAGSSLPTGNVVFVYED